MQAQLQLEYKPTSSSGKLGAGTCDMLAKPMVFDSGTAGELLARMAATMALTAGSLLGV